MKSPGPKAPGECRRKRVRVKPKGRYANASSTKNRFTKTPFLKLLEGFKYQKQGGRDSLAEMREWSQIGIG